MPACTGLYLLTGFRFHLIAYESLFHLLRGPRAQLLRVQRRIASGRRLVTRVTMASQDEEPFRALLVSYPIFCDGTLSHVCLRAIRLSSTRQVDVTSFRLGKEQVACRAHHAAAVVSH